MIVGIDEVGRGAWAGPLCVAAVGLGGQDFPGLTDSKKLSKKKRTQFAFEIKQSAPLVGIGWVSARAIDEFGLSQALKSAARQAVAQLDSDSISHIIVDGTIQLIDDPRATTMKQADLLVPSVSAASIVAKVARDTYMGLLDNVYPGYGHASHVGYGTALHRQALESIGPSPAHRMSFAPLSDQTISKKTKVLTAGELAETAACEYLQRSGFKVLDRNWKTKACEIDIVAQKQNIVHFVEVKYRSSLNQGGGVAAITSKKLHQMNRGAQIWMQKYGIVDGSLSVIEVGGASYEVTEFLTQVRL